MCHSSCKLFIELFENRREVCGGGLVQAKVISDNIAHTSLYFAQLSRFISPFKLGGKNIVKMLANSVQFSCTWQCQEHLASKQSKCTCR